MDPDGHYCIDPLTRLDWDDIQQLINDRKYFALHAPRQTGKTTALLAMQRELNGKGDYVCAYANIEAAQIARNDVSQGLINCNINFI